MFHGPREQHFYSLSVSGFLLTMFGIRINQLEVILPTRHGTLSIFRNLSLHVKPGEFLTLLGPSGCGKTTFLRALAGLITPIRGKIEFTGERNDPAVPRILMVSQEQNLFPWMTVLENVTFGLEMQGVEKEERYALALPLLEQYGLLEWKDSFPYQLSQGMKQRVAVLHCFLSRPHIMLMDEPFVSLDIGVRRGLHRELLDLWRSQRQTVLFVTHDVDEALYLSDRIQLLSPLPATVAGTIDIDFNRPRDISLFGHAEFLALKARTVERLLSLGNGEKSMEAIEF